MYETTATAKALGLPRSAARTARVALATALVAVGLVASPLAAGLVAPPANATTPFIVNSIGDQADTAVADGVCDVTATVDDTCTLRAAIQEANATPGADVIGFRIPNERTCDLTTDVCRIRPGSALPPITEQVTIDGYSQPGAQPNTKTVGDDAILKIELDGINASNASGLEIRNASDSVIRGLVVNDFATGISVSGSSTGNRIEGNFVGTDPSGTQDDGNLFDGVVVGGAGVAGLSLRDASVAASSDFPSQTVVGGATPAARNLISGNGEDGIALVSPSGTRIEGNYIGTDGSGITDLGNTNKGVSVVFASGTTVGGTTAAARNVISGNDGSGLSISSSTGTRVLGNRIGTTAGGAAALGNALGGVETTFSPASGTAIGDGTAAGSNTIAFNGRDGVEVDATSTGVRVSRNSIFSNAGLGMDLLGQGESDTSDVVTPNDTGDADGGANHRQNSPVLSSAKNASGKTTLKGKLNSTPGKGFTVQFFSNPSGNEGKRFLGQKSVTTDASGNATFAFSPASKVALGQTATATATKNATGETSEFSAPRKVAAS
jgi:hypothetical protein